MTACGSRLFVPSASAAIPEQVARLTGREANYSMEDQNCYDPPFGMTATLLTKAHYIPLRH